MMSLVVMAAGLGNRYGGLKQMAPIGPGGETLTDYAVYDALRAGFDRLVFVLRPEIEAEFRAGVTSKFSDRVALAFVHQEIPSDRRAPWGTGHAVLSAAHAIDGPFTVINADDHYGVDALQVVGRHLASGSPDFALVGFRLCDTLSASGGVSRGICRVREGWLAGIEEHDSIQEDESGLRGRGTDGRVRTLDAESVVSMNLWGFTPALFGPLRTRFEHWKLGATPDTEFHLPAVVDELVRDRHVRVRVLPTTGRWSGMTWPSDRAATVATIRGLIDAGTYPERLWGTRNTRSLPG